MVGERRFAEQTNVPVERSQAELVGLIKRHGASAYQWAEQDRRVGLQFAMHDRRIRFVVTLPEPTDKSFRITPTGKARANDAAARAHHQECRRRFRALVLVVKAKFEAIESGIETFEEAFLAHIVLPTNETVGERTIPAIADAYEGRELPALMPPVKADGDG